MHRLWQQQKPYTAPLTYKYFLGSRGLKQVRIAPGLPAHQARSASTHSTWYWNSGLRHVAITQRRTQQDLAHQMRWLVDQAYPQALMAQVVLDNTHRPASLYQAFPVSEARRIVKRLEFHHTPKHGGWLNPVWSLPKRWRRSSSESWRDHACGSVSLARLRFSEKSKPWSTSATAGTLPQFGASLLNMHDSKCATSILPIIKLTDYWGR